MITPDEQIEQDEDETKDIGHGLNGQVLAINLYG